MNKKLILIILSVTTILLGVLAELNAFFLNRGLYESESLTHHISPNLQLKLYDHHLTLYNITESIRVNYANMLVYLCLFAGVIQMVLKKQERNKLIHFAFSILFMYNVFSLTFGQFFSRLSLNLITSLIWSLISIAAIGLSRHKNTIPNTSAPESSGSPVPKYIRSLHFVFDPICFLLIIFEFNYAFSLRGFESISSIFYLLVIYTSFELIWGVTPLKILTNTRVVGMDGQTPKRRHILLRNAARFIPFEFLSYIFSHTGWHDRFSKSRLVKNR